MAQISQEHTLAALLAYIKSPNYKYNYSLEIAKGNVPGSSLITKFGHNDDVDTGSVPEDVWNGGGVYVPPTAARIHTIESTDLNDTAAGTGARTVLIYGINSIYERVTEVVTMNGVGLVSTVNSYYHIHLIQVHTSGSSNTNIGDIIATAVTDGTITCKIDAGQGQSESSIYLVPAGYTAYVMRIRARMNNSTANSTATVAFYTFPFQRAWQIKTKIGINNSGSSFVELDYTDSAPFIVTEKSWIKLRVESVTSNNTPIDGEYDLILVKN